MKIKALALSLLFLPATAWAGDEDDFGTWLELGVEKALPYNLEVGIDGELRTQDNSKRVDRWNIGPSVGYRVNKYLKFNVGYQFLNAYSPSKRKEHYRTNDDGSYKLDADGNPIWNGYKQTTSYWTPKHRFMAEGTFSYKFWKCLRVSLRERYQFTQSCETSTATEKHRYELQMDGNGHFTPDLSEEKDGYPETEQETIEGESRQLLRSRLKLEYDKKRCDWKPFVSVELHNNLVTDLHLDKLRTCLGTSYKINKHNNISLGYVLTFDLTEQPTERMHAVSLGYSYDF